MAYIKRADVGLAHSNNYHFVVSVWNYQCVPQNGCVPVAVLLIVRVCLH